MKSVGKEKEGKKHNDIWQLFEEAQQSMFGLLSSEHVTLCLYNGHFFSLAGNMLCTMIIVQISCT